MIFNCKKSEPNIITDGVETSLYNNIDYTDLSSIYYSKIIPIYTNCL